MLADISYSRDMWMLGVLVYRERLCIGSAGSFQFFMLLEHTGTVRAKGTRPQRMVPQKSEKEIILRINGRKIGLKIAGSSKT